jgi:hypothetical protein
MKNGHDHQDESSNVVSLAGARKQAKAAAQASAGRNPRRERRTTAGQWVTSALLVMLAIGGVFALAVPLLRAAGIVGD